MISFAFVDDPEYLAFTWECRNITHSAGISGNFNDSFAIDDTLAITVNVSGGQGNDVLRGGMLNDMLFGGTGNDSLSGGQDSDTPDGGKGADTLNGGQGDDTYRVTSAGDVVDENFMGDIAPGADGGHDRIIIDVAVWSLSGTGQAGIEDVVMGACTEVTANALDNQITGNPGNNVLNGGSGADMLQGSGRGRAGAGCNAVGWPCADCRGFRGELTRRPNPDTPRRAQPPACRVATGQSGRDRFRRTGRNG